MPYGWALWLRALPAMPAKPHARARDVAALLAERPGTPIPPGRELATWPAFFSLFHQGWQPPPRDERLARWASRIGSGVMHVLFVVFLAWIAYLQSLLPPVPPNVTVRLLSAPALEAVMPPLPPPPPMLWATSALEVAPEV